MCPHGVKETTKTNTASKVGNSMEVEVEVERKPRPSAEAADLIAEILDESSNRWKEHPPLALCCCTESRELM